MLTQVTEGVWTHQSELLQNNTVIVQGKSGVLLIDPGITESELTNLADDLRNLGQPVVAGFATHPDWDHALWHASFGDVPRYGTAECAAALHDLLSQADWKAQVAEGLPPEIADEVPMDLFGHITGLPAKAAHIPWDGPQIRIIQHRAHAQGHAALLIENSHVLAAGDMLSDVLIPMLDLSTADPIGDYLAALQLIEDAADAIDIVIPGHGSIAKGDQVRARINQDRAYVEALRDNQPINDPRIGPNAQKGWEWVSDLHAGQQQQIAQKAR